MYISNASKILNTFKSTTLLLRIYPKAKKFYKDVKMSGSQSEQESRKNLNVK